MGYRLEVVIEGRETVLAMTGAVADPEMWSMSNVSDPNDFRPSVAAEEMLEKMFGPIEWYPPEPDHVVEEGKL